MKQLCKDQWAHFKASSKCVFWPSRTIALISYSLMPEQPNAPSHHIAEKRLTRERQGCPNTPDALLSRRHMGTQAVRHQVGTSLAPPTSAGRPELIAIQAIPLTLQDARRSLVAQENFPPG